MPGIATWRADARLFGAARSILPRTSVARWTTRFVGEVVHGGGCQDSFPCTGAAGESRTPRAGLTGIRRFLIAWSSTLSRVWCASRTASGPLTAPSLPTHSTPATERISRTAGLGRVRAHRPSPTLLSPLVQTIVGAIFGP